MTNEEFESRVATIVGWLIVLAFLAWGIFG